MKNISEMTIKEIEDEIRGLEKQINNLENQKNKSEIDDDEYINGIYERDIWLKNHIQESSVDENER